MPCIPYEAFKFISVRPFVPLRVVTKITPLAARTPYTAVVASLSTETDSISLGSIRSKLSRGIPSTITIGVPRPRILKLLS